MNQGRSVQSTTQSLCERLAVPCTAQLGSSWDLGGGEAEALPHHLGEWAQSTCHPELAAANVESLAGTVVLEALAGARLEALGGWSSQLATAEVRKQLRPLEPVAEAGGWWCSGLDPLADWAPMDWGCFKPDRPRQTLRGPLKYENPHGTPARSFWLRVPAVVAEVVAERWELELPAEVAADASGERGAFWRWWAGEQRLPLVLTEGAKKAGALLSAGVPAVAVNGIYGGCPKNANGTPELLPELAAAPLAGRRCWVLFDWSESERGRRDVSKAARRLGRLLKRAEAAEVLLGACPGPHKGADDHLAAGGTWEQLEAELVVLSPLPVLPWLRPADQTAPAGRHLGDACPIPSPEQARLVALQAPMGSGKTCAIAAAVEPLRQAGTRVVLLTHRRSLGATTAEQLGLPWADEAAPGSDLRQLGIALCVDSLCPASGMRFRAADWRGAVVVVDEAAQVIAHTLMATGTAVAQRRLQVIDNLRQLLAGAAQVIAADAQLSQPVLDALETATGERALLIASEHRPAAGRRLQLHSRESWRLALVEQLEQRRPVWIATTAQKAGATNSAQNLAQLVGQHWPEARVLVVDSETVADPAHAASQLATDPNEIAAAYEVVIATPAIAAGLSVELRGRFAAVFGWAGGTTDPAAAAQAMARVRDDCPRHLYAPEQSPGGHLRMGCGATDPNRLLRQLANHEAAVVAQLIAAGGWAPQESGGGHWLDLWAQLACAQNAQRLAYRATVQGLLEREGYRVEQAEALVPEQQAAAGRIAEQLRTIAAATQTAEDEAVIAAELLSDAEAAELLKRSRLTPAERAKLQRWRVAHAWGLGSAAPTAELLEAHRDGRHRRQRFGWLVMNREARQLAARADAAAAPKLTPDGVRSWAPDLCRELEGPRLSAADALGLPGWLERTDWFGADDPRLVELQAIATAHAASMTQLLGISPGKRATTTLRQLLAAAGYRLESSRRRCGAGRRAAAGYRYRVVREAPPPGTSLQAMEASWEQQLRSKAEPLWEGFKPVPGSEGAGFFGRGVYRNPPHKEWG